MEKLLTDAFLAVLNMSISASFVIAGILVARLLLAKAPGIFSYALWGVALFRLLCPFSIESVLSLIPVNSQTVPPTIIYSPVPRIDSGIAVMDRVVNNVLPAATPQASANPLQILIILGAYLWTAAALAMLLYSAVSYLRLKRRVSRALLLDGNIYECESISSPFVLGLVKPRIYLPLGMKGDEYSYIVAHEQTHIRRLDYLVKPLAFLALCLHWFNPLCWFAFRLCVKDMEMSCDEAVIKQLGGSIKRGYSDSLLAMAGNHPSFGGSPLAFGESNIKSRIKNIISYHKPALWLIVTAVVFVAAVGCGLMTSPKSESAAEPPAQTGEAEHAEETKLVEGFLTELYAVNDYESYLSYMDAIEGAGMDMDKREPIMEGYFERFRPYTTQDCYDDLVAGRLTEYAAKFSFENGYLFEITDITLTVDVDDDENLQFIYAVDITATGRDGSVDKRAATGPVALKYESDGVMRINSIRFDRAYYTPLTPPRTPTPEPSNQPLAEGAGSEHYLKLVESKAEITKVVAERVEQYRNGTPPDNPNHHPPYPADFPPASQLPVITSPGQFAIREETNLDALGAIYAAVRIDSTHEMRIGISQYVDDGKVSWGSGDTWLVSVKDRGYYAWVLTDVDIHNGELPADFMGKALSRGLTQEQVKSLITRSLREEEILNLPMQEIDFIFYMSEAANTVDSEGFTTLDFIQLTSMNESADSEWVQAGNSFLGMTVKSVYAKGVPYAPYLAAAIEQDVQFAGATWVGGRFEKRDDGLVFIVSENEQGGMPSLHSPSSDTIVFNNQQTAEKVAAATPDAFTECRIIIENYRIQTSNDTVKMVYDEAGEVTDYTADDSKTVLVQSADIRQA